MNKKILLSFLVGFVLCFGLLSKPQITKAQSNCSAPPNRLGCPSGTTVNSNGLCCSGTSNSNTGSNTGGTGGDCSFECRVPGTPICTACQKSKGIDTTTTTTSTSTSKSGGTGIDPTSGCTNGINTAVGCISVLGDQSVFLGEILKWAVGVGSGIAFLLILYSGFMIMSSAGDPTRLKAGQELLTSAISGLILLVFSVFVLKFIGVDILGLGAFGFGK